VTENPVGWAIRPPTSAACRLLFGLTVLFQPASGKENQEVTNLILFGRLSVREHPAARRPFLALLNQGLLHLMASLVRGALDEKGSRLSPPRQMQLLEHIGEIILNGLIA
jgi:hypothetical protein